MSSRGVTFLALGLLLAGGGCVQKKDITSLEIRLTRVQENQEVLKSRIAAIDSLLERQALGEQTARADLQARLSVFQDRLAVLERKLDDVIQLLHGGGEVPRAARRLESGELPSSQVGTEEPDPRELYNTALLDLRRGNFELALWGFQEYLRRVPGDPFSPNAQYWIGEVFYAQGEWDRALAEFQKVLERFPNAPKAASALYKIGKTYQAQGRMARAREAMERVVSQFPDSPEARQAEQDLDEFGG